MSKNFQQHDRKKNNQSPNNGAPNPQGRGYPPQQQQQYMRQYPVQYYYPNQTPYYPPMMYPQYMYPVEQGFNQMQINPMNYPGQMGQYNPYGQPKYSPEQSLVGRSHDVLVQDYNDKGIVVEFRNNVTGLLQWTAFSKSVQSLETEDRLEFCKDRVPVGSQLNVYVNSADENGMILTLSMKSAPILNYKPLEKDAKAKGKSDFRYLIVIDMEATCDYSTDPVVDDSNSEIIEFPWVVIDTETLETVHEMQVHVKPSNMKGITPYCRVLTGITEEVLEKAGSLADAVKQFDEYIATLQAGSFMIVCDGVWDLKQLHDEATRKGIKLASHYNQYLNIKSEFRKFLPIFPWKPHEPPLHIMLQALSLKFIGTPHRGIDDCFTIASVVKAIALRGHHFKEAIAVADFNDPAYIRFSSKAPVGSWKCNECTEKWTRSTDEGVAIWNKPFLPTCRFCNGPRPTE
jgi:inhibitor of KinA sporulation pathway (predicted exonuclease)